MFGSCAIIIKVIYHQMVSNLIPVVKNIGSNRSVKHLCTINTIYNFEHTKQIYVWKLDLPVLGLFITNLYATQVD